MQRTTVKAGDNKMNNENRITLKEMAQKLNRCPKTFRKYVVEYQIPHICLGRDMLFDTTEVENYLSNLTLIKQSSTQEFPTYANKAIIYSRISDFVS